MAIKRVSTVVGAVNLAGSVAFWKTVLGTDPTFVDGERWAQFDIGPVRLSLGAGSENPGGAAVMVSVDDLDGFCADLRSAGIDPGPETTGPHERRVTFRGPAGETVIAYAALA